MKKIKICVVILLIIIIILIVGIIVVNKNKENINLETEDFIDEVQVEVKTLQRIGLSSEYYTLLGCVQEYYRNISIIRKEDYSDIIEEYGKNYVDKMKTQAQQRIEQILDRNYTKKYGTDIINKYSFASDVKVILDDVGFYNINQNEVVYLVRGYLIDYGTYDIQDISLLVIMNYDCYCYSIFEQDYINDTSWKNMKVDSTVDMRNFSYSVDAQEYNKFQDKDADDEELVKDYFYIYKINALHNINKAFDLLNENYRKYRFRSIEEYSNYIDRYRNSLGNSELLKYTVSIENGVKQYVCIDSNEKYYIFNEESIMNFNVLLDSYTIDIPLFVTKYEGSEENVKIQYNINNIVEAINDSNYVYVYNKLNKDFKNNNYPTQQQLEKELEDRLFSKNKLEIVELQKEGTYYRCDTAITNKDDENEQKKMIFFIRLNENNSFEISFTIDD